MKSQLDELYSSTMAFSAKARPNLLLSKEDARSVLYDGRTIPSPSSFSCRPGGNGSDDGDDDDDDDDRMPLNPPELTFEKRELSEHKKAWRG